ncbi:MAG: starch-binding protein [Ruminococcus sp.]|nr:starch-binding protein [Ruminococcus sp.]
MKGKTKRTASRFCSAVLSATTLMSMLTFFPANAVEAEQKPTEKPQASYENTDIPKDMRASGDLTIEQGLSENAKIIKSIDEYYKELENDDITVLGKVKRKKNAPLPASVDNSTSKYFPPIGNQGSLGTCVGWAQAYYQFTYEMNKSMDVASTSQNAFSPKFVYNYANGAKDEGSNSENVFDFMKHQGSVPLSLVPYDGKNYLDWSATEEVWSTAIKYRVNDYQYFDLLGNEETRITSVDDEDIKPIKEALSNGEVLSFSNMISCYVYDTLKTNAAAPENNNFKGQKVVVKSTGIKGGHRMTIVGYNDNIWTDSNKNNTVDAGEMGAFKVANSWGDGWSNNGYIWIAYDAINTESCVEGVPADSARNQAMTSIARIEVKPYNTGADLYLKYTLNSCNRNTSKGYITAELNGTKFTNSVYPVLSYGSGYGNLNYKGETGYGDGTMVCALDNIVPEVTSENFEDYTWSVRFEDTKADGEILTVKDAQIVDKTANKTYRPNNTFPYTLDKSDRETEFFKTTLNNAVVYYRGYNTPTLHYSINGGAFNTVEMTNNLERRGYLYKYVIELDQKSDVKLYFSDKNGKIDDNNGYNFTAYTGLNYYVTENVKPPLTAKISNDFDSLADVNQSVMFNVEVSGGYAPYQYQFIYKNLKTGKIIEKTYRDNFDLGEYINDEGDYLITVNVKDYSDTVVSASETITCKDMDFEFTSLTANTDKAILAGTEVNFTAKTRYESIIAWGPYRSDYIITVKEGNNVCYTAHEISDDLHMGKRRSTIIFPWKPYKSGNYTVTIGCTDYKEQYAEKSINVTVLDNLIGDVSGDGSIDVSDVTDLQMHISKTIENEDFRSTESDCNSDGEVNINDATCIQLYIAQYIGGSSVGEKIEIIPETTVPPTTVPPTTQPTTQPTTVKVTNKVTFTNSFNWGGTISCYYWSDSNKSMTTWPGKAMTYYKTNDYGEKMYTFEVPKGATYVIFTNGSSQTTDIKYPGGEVRYYPISSTDSKGHNLVNTW